MKRFHLRIELFILLMVNALPMHGMFTGLASRAGKRGASQKAAAKRSGAVQALYSQVASRNGSREEGEQGPTLAQQAPQSWFSRLWSNSAPAREKIAQAVNSDSINTFLYGQPVTKKLTPEEFADQFRKSNSRFLSGYDSRGLAFYTPVFDQTDFEKAKELIDRHKEYLNSLTGDAPLGSTNDHYVYRFFNNLSSEIQKSYFEVTILDIALRKFFYNGRGHYYNVSEQNFNRIKLLKYLVDSGAKINPANKKLYEHAYLTHMMTYYKLLQKGVSAYGVDYELPLIKKIFHDFDPILEKIIPEFKNALHEAQKERIELDDEAYKAKMQDKNDREEYLRAKIKQKEIEWRLRNNNWNDTLDLDSRITKEWENVQFDEQEYKQWLKNGKSFFKFDFKFNSGFGSRQQPPRTATSPSKTFQELLGVSEAATNAAIMKAYRAFLKENHLDHLQSLVSSGAMTQVDADERIEKVKKLNDAYDYYKVTRPKVTRENAQGANE